MIYAARCEEFSARPKPFLRKWRLKHRAVADSPEEAGDRLFAFVRPPLSQWRSARSTNEIERLHEKFRRWIKTQSVLPSAETASILFWALLALGANQHAQGRWLAGARHSRHMGSRYWNMRRYCLCGDVRVRASVVYRGSFVH
jgi:transposase-like protein